MLVKVSATKFSLLVTCGILGVHENQNVCLCVWKSSFESLFAGFLYGICHRVVAMENKPELDGSGIVFIVTL